MEPLSLERHFDDLCRIGLEPELWRFTIAQIRSPADLRAYLDEALAEQAAGRSLPFATVHKGEGRAVGCTRFGNIEPRFRKVEIGWTWVGKPHQRTVVNTEAKLLMLTHAFETWGCVRVELKTDVLNQRSRNAMLRIGCTEEGILRSHQITDAGRLRDTIYYSILEDEWPGARVRLERMLAEHGSAAR